MLSATEMLASRPRLVLEGHSRPLSEGFGLGLGMSGLNTDLGLGALGLVDMIFISPLAC